MLHIHNDTRRLVVLGDEKSVQQVLEALEGLVTASDEALGLIGPDLENQVAVTKLLLDFHDESEVPENGIQDFFGCLVHCSEGEEGLVVGGQEA